MRTVMVSIGRNIGNEPMSDRDWTAFVNATSNAIRRAGESPEIHFGHGTWDGIREESAHITVYRHTDTEIPRTAIYERLAFLAEYFGQDAIALSISEPILIPSK
jgi:hypothetical protein